MTPSPALPLQPVPAYRWNWRYFRIGLADYVRARRAGELKPSRKVRTPGSMVATGAAALAVMLVLALVVGWVAPAASGVLGNAGVPLLTALGVGLITLGSLALLVALPCALGLKGWRFANEMARRGWEIEHGLRVATQGVV